MSTRRPRIRAVATLPTRRKQQTKDNNVDVNVDDSNSETNISVEKTDLGSCKISPKKNADDANKDGHEDIPQKRNIKTPVKLQLKDKSEDSNSAINIIECDGEGKLKSLNKNKDNKNSNFESSCPEKTLQESDSTTALKSAGVSSIGITRRRTVKPLINIGAANRKEKTNSVSEPVNKDADKPKEVATIADDEIHKPLISNQTESPKTSQTSVNLASPNDSKDHPQRRRTVKPTINILAANRKSKPQEKTPERVPSCKESPSRSHDKICVSPSRKQSLNNSMSSVLSPRNKQISDAIDCVRTPNVNDLSLSINNSINDSGDDVSFDPIIPLPSASKTNRPKLKPTPRFALRRNSFQGSASEAEEIDAPPSPPPANLPSIPSVPSSTSISTPSSVVRVRHTSTTIGPIQQHKSRTTHRYKVGANIPHQARTMKDLIFYNPPNNAIQPKDEESNRDLCQIQPPVVTPDKTEDPPESEEPEAMPVPQVKLGPNGEIVIDEQSLVIETSEAVRSRQRLQQLSVVWDGGNGSGGGKYMRGRRCREWTHRETLRFYRALHTVGTDFSLMLSLFPGRSRRDLKVKFKKEERQNGHLVDKVLTNQLQFNMDELDQATIIDMQEEEKEKERAKEAANVSKLEKTQPVKRKRTGKYSSIAAQSIGEECLRSYCESPNPKPLHKFSNKKLRTDFIANTANITPVIPSPARSLLPPHLEQGSLVLLQEKDGLKAYLAGGETLKPLPLSQDDLQRIAAKLGQRIS